MIGDQQHNDKNAIENNDAPIGAAQDFPKSVAAAVNAPESDQTDGTGVIDFLAELNDETLLTEKALAAKLKKCPRTVQRMVARCELPPPIKFASENTFRVGTIRKWIHDRIATLEETAHHNAKKIWRLGNR